MIEFNGQNTKNNAVNLQVMDYKKVIKLINDFRNLNNSNNITQDDEMNMVFNLTDLAEFINFVLECEDKSNPKDIV